MNEITLLDGGMGGELARRGAGNRTELWSAQALLDAPEVVADVHRDYIDAGARIIITNSYSTIPSYLGKLGMADRFPELTALAGRIARQVADDAAPDVRVAGSMPPLDESYRADLVPDQARAAPIYTGLAEALAPHVDLYICETMSTAQEARNAANAALGAGAGQPVYVSWTLDERPGQGLRSGESIADACAALADLDIAAFLFNCTSPEAIGQGLKELRQLTDQPIGAYPNRLHIPAGWTLDNEVRTEVRSELDIEQFVDAACSWVGLGATLIGGCCGIGPPFIAALGDALATLDATAS